MSQNNESNKQCFFYAFIHHFDLSIFFKEFSRILKNHNSGFSFPFPFQKEWFLKNSDGFDKLGFPVGR